MSKGTKYLITFTAAAGGLYWYDGSVLPIFPRQQQIPQRASTPEKARDEVREQIELLRDKKQDLDKKACNFASKKKDAAAKKIDSVTNSIKNSPVVNTLSESRLDTQKKVKELDISEEEEPDRGLLTSATRKYIEVVNSVGEYISPNSGRSNKEIQKAEARTRSWFNWFGSKADEAADDVHNDIFKARRDAEKTKNWLFSWGREQKDEAADAIDNERNSWFSWTRKRKEDVERKAGEIGDGFDRWKRPWLSRGTRAKEETADEVDNLRKDLRARWDSEKAHAREEIDYTKKTWDDRYNKGVAKAGQTVDDTKRTIDETYEQGKKTAQEKYEAAKTRLQELGDRAKSSFKTADPDPNDRLKQAQHDFNDAFENLNSYGGDFVDLLDEKYYKPFESSFRKN